MTPEILTWGETVISRYRLADTSVLELGSFDVNGSLRQFFTGPYLGVDQFDGPGVDRRMTVDQIPDDWAFDTVVCTEMLEHDLTFWVSLQKMASVLHSGGFLILSTCGIAFPRHDYPSDYYRFTTDALTDLLNRFGFDVLETKQLQQYPTVVAVGRRW